MCPLILLVDIDRYASLEHTHCANTLMFIKKFQSFNVPSVNKSIVDYNSGVQKHKMT